jgi:hypothetical protein
MRHGSTALACTVLLGLPFLLGSLVHGQSDPATASLPDDRLGIRSAPLLLLSRPDVRADLELSPAQAEKAERAVTDLYLRASTLKGKAGGQALAERKRIDDAQRDWIATNLTPKQCVRLDQVDMQWEGPSALVSRISVTTTVGLSPDQVQALKQAVAKRNDARAGGRYTADDERALARQARSILTPQQWTTWLAMLGRPFAPQIALAKDKTQK